MTDIQRVLILGLVFCLTSLTVNSQTAFDDSLFYVYPMKVNISDEIKEAHPIKPEDLTFQIPHSFYENLFPYTLIMILEIDAYGHQYFQFELGKGFEMRKRKTILFTRDGRKIADREHKVRTP